MKLKNYRRKKALRDKAAIAFLIVLGALPSIASATTVTYDFTVTTSNGPLAGTTSQGEFSYDTSSVPLPNTNYGIANFLTNLSFTWNGQTYSAATANTGGLTTNNSGGLSFLFFGNYCSAGTCASQSYTDEWYATLNFPSDSGIFEYADYGPYVYTGTVTANAVVPIPSSGWLLLSALGGLSALGHRRTKLDH